MRECIFCRSSGTKIFSAKDFNRRVNSNKFYYVKCPNCKLIYINEVPINLDDFYQNNYHGENFSEEFLELVRQFQKSKVDILKKYVAGSLRKILEIGCSNGAFLYAMRKENFIVCGIEQDKKCVDFLNQQIDIKCILASKSLKSDLGLLKETYTSEIVVMWHVIEHLAEPFQAIMNISEYLEINGHLVISTPNPESIQFKISRKYWPHLDAPRHLYLIPAKILTEKLVQSKFEIIAIFGNDPDGKNWDKFGWEKMLQNFNLKYLSFLIPLIKCLEVFIAKLTRNTLSQHATYTIVARKISND